jgi:DUF1009 family protein
MKSRFLPEGWDGPIAILAGQGGVGSYPYTLAQSAREMGADLRLLALKGETSDELKQLFDKEHLREVAVGEIGGAIKALKELGAKGVIMAGRVTPGRVFDKVFPDLKAMTIWMGLKEKNAETIFGAICAEFEKEGIAVLDARSFLDNALADNGIMVKGSEDVPAEAIEHGIKIAEAQAQLDVGQGVVVRKGTVLAVEAFEGTNAMLERAAQFKTEGKIFVKTVKAHQDYRFDVPIFGLTTLEKCAASSIKTVVLKSDGVIMIGKAEVLKKPNSSEFR